jgi:hypothetical protein
MFIAISQLELTQNSIFCSIEIQTFKDSIMKVEDFLRFTDIK